MGWGGRLCSDHLLTLLGKKGMVSPMAKHIPPVPGHMRLAEAGESHTLRATGRRTPHAAEGHMEVVLGACTGGRMSQQG